MSTYEQGKSFRLGEGFSVHIRRLAKRPGYEWFIYKGPFVNQVWYASSEASTSAKAKTEAYEVFARHRNVAGSHSGPVSSGLRSTRRDPVLPSPPYHPQSLLRREARGEKIDFKKESLLSKNPPIYRVGDRVVMRWGDVKTIQGISYPPWGGRPHYSTIDSRGVRDQYSEESIAKKDKKSRKRDPSFSKNEMGWDKDQDVVVRIDNALRSHKGNALAAARALRTLANVTTDKRMKILAKSDANFLFDWAEGRDPGLRRG